MGLFNRSKNLRGTLFGKPVYEPKVTEKDVVDYMVNLNRQSYTKMLKVIEIYRKAEQEVEKLLPREVLPPQTWSANEDTELGNFLDDDQPKKPKAKKGKGAR